MIPRQTVLRLALFSLFTASLGACGGGGGDPSAIASSPQAPAVDQATGPAAGSSSDAASGSGNVNGQPGGGGADGSTTAPAAPGGSAVPDSSDGDAGSTSAAFGKGLRDRMLATLAGSAALSCDNGAIATSITVDADSVRFGAVARPLASLTKFVVGQIPERAPTDGTLAGPQFRVQLRFADASGPIAYDLRFDPSGQLADVVVGTPDANDASRDRLSLAATSYCKPRTGAAWNAVSGLKVSPDASYALIHERKASRPARELTCRTPSGVQPEQWAASIWVDGGILWSTPRASLPADGHYRYAPDDHLSHYTVIDGAFDVTEWDRLVIGGQWWGYSLTLGHDESIIAMAVDNRPGAPSTQTCGLD